MSNGASGKSCRKVAYYSKADARTAFNDFGKDRGAKRFYKCPFCKAKSTWHLTSEPKR